MKNRQYVIQLQEASKHLSLTNATEKLYNVLAIEFPKSNKTSNNTWDPEETLYDGQKWLQSMSQIVFWKKLANGRIQLKHGFFMT